MSARLLAILFCCGSFVVSVAPLRAQTPAPSALHEKTYGVYPIAYQELVTRWLGEQLIDPPSAQIEWLGEPKPVVVKASNGETFSGYVVDFKVNSRNKFGMYTGKQARRVYIRDGSVVSGGRVPK